MFINTIESIRKITKKRYLIVFLALALNACRTAPIYNSTDISISPRSTATDKEIGEAIWSAGRSLEWRIKKVRPGQMSGVFKKNTHRAVVAIHYDKAHFNILYQDSDNLKYDGNDIHVNYNVWIHKLEQKIQNKINFNLP